MASLVGKKDGYDSDEERQIVETEEEEVTKEPEEITTLENPDVVTKYMDASKMANAVLQEVMAMCVADAKVLDICVAGDKSIEDVRYNIIIL